MCARTYNYIFHLKLPDKKTENSSIIQTSTQQIRNKYLTVPTE
jgi:hypothetical protein